jgi:hypothetical protein
MSLAMTILKQLLLMLFEPLYWPLIGSCWTQ